MAVRQGFEPQLDGPKPSVLPLHHRTVAAGKITPGHSSTKQNPVDQPAQFRQFLDSPQPVLALAPMQDVTDLPFWELMSRHGGPDLYFTEYFRVHAESHLEKPILRSLDENPTGRPAVAQMIGNHIPSLIRSARQLQQHPVAAIDLNLGCPAPIVYKKCAGGGLLREPARIDAILGALREAIEIPFTVKTRIGFDTPEIFDQLLTIFARHSLDLLTVHGRTVKEGYRSAVHYDLIRLAADTLPCPVLANGNIYSAAKAESVLTETNAAGLMIGRGAIRNPWLFQQIRRHLGGQTQALPSGRDVLAYLRDLYHTVRPPGLSEKSHVQKMKKYMNYIGLGIESTGDFLHRIRRAQTEADFFGICEDHLQHDQPMPLYPMDLDLKSTDLLAGQHR